MKKYTLNKIDSDCLGSISLVNMYRINVERLEDFKNTFYHRLDSYKPDQNMVLGILKDRFKDFEESINRKMVPNNFLLKISIDLLDYGSFSNVIIELSRFAMRTVDGCGEALMPYRNSMVYKLPVLSRDRIIAIPKDHKRYAHYDVISTREIVYKHRIVTATDKGGNNGRHFNNREHRT